jgi:hypothetical protein
LQPLRRRLHLLEDAVYSKADPEFLIERLEMNIARAEPMGLDKKHRDQANDRRVRFVGAAEVAPFGDLESEPGRAPDFFGYIASFFGTAVIFVERLLDFFRTGANQLDLALQQKAQTIDRLDIERIAHGHDQSALAETDRNDLEAPRVFRAHLVDHFRRNDRGREIDPIHVGLGGVAPRHVRVKNDRVFFWLHDPGGCFWSAERWPEIAA